MRWNCESLSRLRGKTVRAHGVATSGTPQHVLVPAVHLSIATRAVRFIH